MNNQILKVLHFIETHIDEDFDIETLSKIAGYSPFYFCRIFKVSVGESVMSYSSRLRIKKASADIINSEKSIIAIALDVGFETPNGFNKAFKKIFNMTPTEYRKKHLELLFYYKENRVKTPKIVQRENTYIVYNTKYGAYETSAAQAWEELIWKLDSDKRINILTNNELFGICHNDPEITPPEQIRYDASISCDKKSAQEFEKNGFSVRVLEGGRFATTTYIGEENVNKTWMDLFSWIVENELSSLCKDVAPFEKYLNWSPNIDDKDLIKEIYIPIN
jgi:AraC family transcriptional regulator